MAKAWPRSRRGRRTPVQDARRPPVVVGHPGQHRSPGPPCPAWTTTSTPSRAGSSTRSRGCRSPPRHRPRRDTDGDADDGGADGHGPPAAPGPGQAGADERDDPPTQRGAPRAIGEPRVRPRRPAAGRYDRQADHGRATTARPGPAAPPTPTNPSTRRPASVSTSPGQPDREQRRHHHRARWRRRRRPDRGQRRPRTAAASARAAARHARASASPSSSAAAVCDLTGHRLRR